MKTYHLKNHIEITKTLSNSLNGKVYECRFKNQLKVLKFTNKIEIQIYYLLKQNHIGTQIEGLVNNKSELGIILPYADKNLDEYINEYIAKDENIISNFFLKNFGNIAKEIDFLHSKGFIHRDLHPGNILHFKNGWHLIDFALCRHYQSYIPDSSHGIVRYASPRQIRGEKESPIDDLYSFLSILCYIDTLKKPWDNIHNEASLLLIKSTNPSPDCSCFFKKYFQNLNQLKSITAVSIYQQFLKYKGLN